ncbi:MAG: hypothetical protein ABI830_07540 [Pseudolabrys sp.]
MSKMHNDRLDKLLERTLKRSVQDDAKNSDAVARVLARLSGPLPRQKMALWRLPEILLDWQFAPAWPRVVALACCAMLGFFIGLAGLDRTVDPADAAWSYVGRTDLGVIVIDPGAQTAARPGVQP